MPLLPEMEPVDLVKSVIGVAREPAPAGPVPTSRDDVRTPEGGAHQRRVPLGPVLAGRRSVRTFAAAGLSLDELTTVLDLAENAHRRQWHPADGLAGLTVLAAPYRVEGPAPGWLHSRDLTDGQLNPLSAPSWLPELRGTYAAAPCLLLICGSLQRAGATGYGRLLVRAGALGHSIWLSARTYGLDCSVYASTSRKVTREIRSLEHAPRHLFTVALGRARETGDA